MDSAEVHRPVHPSLFMFLILPYGAMGGYVTVALAYLYAQAGIPVAQVAALVASSLAPHTLKFIWAPLVDTTLSRKSWYLIASVVSAVGILATAVFPVKESSLPLLTIVVLVSNFAVTFLGMAAESLMAYDTPAELKGRAGGWLQAGNLGGAGIGGGVGLWLAQHLPAQWMAGAILAGACLLCCVALVFLPEPASTIQDARILRTFVNLFKDLWSVATARMGLLALFLCFLPIGSGAASNLWSAVADGWQASANTVEIVTGVLGGILSAVGCLMGGWICDRMDRKMAYVLYGLLQAASAIGMAVSPRTEPMFIFWTCLYAVITGLTFAGFSAFVLEAMGTGAAATKYNVFASLSNIPIYYMTQLDGWAYTRWGPHGMLETEAALGVLGMVLFFALLAAENRFRPRSPSDFVLRAP